MLTRRTYTAIIVCSLIVTGVGVAMAAAWHSTQTDAASASDKVSEAAALEKLISASSTTPVRVFEVGSAEPTRGTNTFTGVVRARYQTEVAFRVPGKILKRHVEVGEKVVPGQLLFELDPGDYLLQQKSAQANLAVAEAALRRAERDEKRLIELQRVNAVSTADYEQSLSLRDIAVGQKESAEKQLELAANQVAYARITAEQSGVVMSIDAEAGQVVAAGTRVCLVAQGGEYEAVVDVPEKRTLNLTERERHILQTEPTSIAAEVTFWSRPDVRTKARLRELSPIADAMSRTYQARFSLLDPPADIKLGMTATVTLATTSEASGFSIPISAVFKRNGEPAVWLVDIEHGTLQPTTIKVSVYGDEWMTVTEGLTAGQKVVSAGVQKLDEGVKVHVWEQQK